MTRAESRLLLTKRRCGRNTAMDSYLIDESRKLHVRETLIARV